MRARAKLKLAGELIEIQHVKRIAAEVALAAAKRTEDIAREEEEAAQNRSRMAFDDWQIYLGKPGFSPELSQSLSLRLIEREKEAGAAAIGTRLAIDSHARSERDWQRAEAHVRSSEIVFRKLARKVRRRAEEEALSRSADLITYAWGRS